MARASYVTSARAMALGAQLLAWFLRRHVAEFLPAVDTGWSSIVQKGDILIGGRNFGMGSSRPAARSLRNLGLGCLLAESINGLFYRNAVNFAFPAMEVPGIVDAFTEGDTAEVSFTEARVVNLRTETALNGIAMPAPLMRILEAGGIYPLLEREGLVAASP